MQIEIEDVNDNIPTFDNQDDNGYIIGTVDENKEAGGDVVTILKANDSDITPAFKTVPYAGYNHRQSVILVKMSVITIMLSQKLHIIWGAAVIGYLGEFTDQNVGNLSPSWLP